MKAQKGEKMTRLKLMRYILRTGFRSGAFWWIVGRLLSVCFPFPTSVIIRCHRQAGLIRGSDRFGGIDRVEQVWPWLGLPGGGNRKGAVKGPSLPGDVSRGSAKSQHALHSRQERVLAIDE